MSYHARCPGITRVAPPPGIGMFGFGAAGTAPSRALLVLIIVATADAAALL